MHACFSNPSSKSSRGLLPSEETLDAMSNSVFMMIGPKGPIYEVAPDAMKAIEGPNSYQFILHAALDMVDEVEWATPTLFLKTIDKFEDKSISAYVTPGRCIFLLMHDNKSDDNVLHFFKEVHEMYIKIIMNPLQKRGDKIVNKEFDARVKKVMKSFV